MRDAPHLLSAGLETHAGFEPVEAEWDELADRVGAPPFMRPGWFAAWWAAFGRGSLEILVLRRDGRMTAVLPMARRAGALTSLSNWHTPVFGATAEPCAEPELARRLLDRGARRVALGMIDADAPLVAACRGARVLARTMQRSPYLTIAGTWDEFVRNRVSSNRRHDLRRRRRRLAERGEVALEISAGDDLDRRLDEGFALEARSWKGGTGTAIASRPETRRFYADVARWAAGRGELVLAFLRVDGRPVAFDLTLEARGVHYGLKTGYDPDYRRFAPGLLLRAEMLARAFGHGLQVVEFCGDAVPWKLEWTQTWHERVQVQAFAPGIAGRLDCAAQAYGRPLARRVLARARR